MEQVVEAALKHLRANYPVKTAFLYGSFANGTATPESDIDIVLFAEVDEKSHDSTVILNHFLDAWIYPVGRADDVSSIVHILPCSTLVDADGISERILKSIADERARKTVPYSDDERKLMVSWISKMLIRASQDSPEAHYRYHWLLTDFPELYCRFKNLYYDGPMKTLRMLQGSDPSTYDRYSALLRGERNLPLVEELFNEIRGS